MENYCYFCFFALPPGSGLVLEIIEIMEFIIAICVRIAIPLISGSGLGAGDNRIYEFHYSYLYKNNNSTTTFYIPLVCLKT